MMRGENKLTPLSYIRINELMLDRDEIKEFSNSDVVNMDSLVKALEMDKVQEDSREVIEQTGDVVIARYMFEQNVADEGEEEDIEEYEVHILFYGDEILAATDYYEDEDYSVMNASYFNTIQMVELQNEIISKIKERTIEYFTAVEDSNEADCQYYAEKIAEFLGIDVTTLERKEIGDDE